MVKMVKFCVVYYTTIKNTITFLKLKTLLFQFLRNPFLGICTFFFYPESHSVPRRLFGGLLSDLGLCTSPGFLSLGTNPRSIFSDAPQRMLSVSLQAGSWSETRSPPASVRRPRCGAAGAECARGQDPGPHRSQLHSTAAVWPPRPS